MNLSPKEKTNGLPLLVLLTALFAILKGAGVCQFSWGVVTAPLWIFPAFFLGVIALVLGSAVTLAALTGFCILVWVGVEWLAEKCGNQWRAIKRWWALEKEAWSKTVKGGA